jgi:hypothetical protein
MQQGTQALDGKYDVLIALRVSKGRQSRIAKLTAELHRYLGEQVVHGYVWEPRSLDKPPYLLLPPFFEPRSVFCHSLPEALPSHFVPPPTIGGIPYEGTV